MFDGNTRAVWRAVAFPNLSDASCGFDFFLHISLKGGKDMAAAAMVGGNVNGVAIVVMAVVIAAVLRRIFDQESVVFLEMSRHFLLLVPDTMPFSIPDSAQALGSSARTFGWVARVVDTFTSFSTSTAHVAPTTLITIAIKIPTRKLLQIYLSSCDVGPAQNQASFGTFVPCIRGQDGEFDRVSLPRCRPNCSVPRSAMPSNASDFDNILEIQSRADQLKFSCGGSSRSRQSTCHQCQRQTQAFALSGHPGRAFVALVPRFS
eukprot:CAMPEP_0168842446 /NCGR_PEP_ID=MMETSP0727-20121128/7697_1 /TAXON_ID=265536 /ORGANISM="Amphiprora sp., Strain CCMP467" /LENGTH=261 /DNA_ID=CAMNT_0008896001 /DNA_START=84 /DNA_END=866 /DNA_ORIENTATION=-